MAAATPPPDFNTLARRPSERLAIVEHVFDTTSLQETDYLEWKASYDLSAKVGAGKTAKHLIGFANREPAAAARIAEGHAYLLIGVEPRNLVGVPRWDSADVEAWLSRFVQRELVYDVDYIDFQGRDVLMLTVAPPKQGDPVFAMQKATGDGTFQIAEGAIFIRRGGKTETPTAADIAMLSARASTTTTTSLALTLRADATRLVALAPEQLGEGFRERYLADRRRKLLSALPNRADLLAWSMPNIGETRRTHTFISQVDSWIEDARKRWPVFASCAHLAHHDSKLGLVLVNPTDENFEDVVVEVTLPLRRGFVWLDATEAREELAPPREPAPWGKALALRPSLARLGAAAKVHGPDIAALGDDNTRIRFAPLHLYPRAEAKLSEVLVLVWPTMQGTSLDVEWQASAKNTRGVVSGRLAISLPGVQDDARGTEHDASTSGEPAEDAV